MLIKSKYGYSVWRWKNPIRGFKYLWKRIRYGWDDSETWNLDVTIARFVYPRLRRLKEINHGYPSDLTPEIWFEYQDKMLYAFDSIINGKTDDLISDIEAQKKEQEKIDEGLKLFAEYFQNLWD